MDGLIQMVADFGFPVVLGGAFIFIGVLALKKIIDDFGENIKDNNVDISDIKKLVEDFDDHIKDNKVDITDIKKVLDAVVIVSGTKDTYIEQLTKTTDKVASALNLLSKSIDNSVEFNKMILSDSKHTHAEIDKISDELHDTKTKVRETKVIIEQLLLMQVGSGKAKEIIQYGREQAVLKANEEKINKLQEKKKGDEDGI